MPLDQNPHQTGTRFGCVGFSMYACWFSVTQMRQFCLFTYPPRYIWLQLLNQSNFVCHHAKVFMQNSSKWWLRNVHLLRTTVELMLMAFHIHILPQQQYSVLAFYRRGYASFFHYFHKITNIRSWRCFSSSKIRTQFSHIFCNVTIVQAYTQPYSFGGSLKVIICQICISWVLSFTK